ncbi:PAS domain-containing protein [Flagellimonas sp. 389]|uniref:PAS domain-containing sensor histidine kinase n=1 Tax=Flagellimonas sp. 389 TaxID=2835862 RepID=UPI001BD5E03F|nr:PAS domain-containing protein [Flagellimonas sp. 389]MBS9463202.1 PAS domain-containing protein [Flagellimonas sp. 389]
MKTIEKTHTQYLLKQLPKATVLVGKNHEVIDFSDSWLAIFNLKAKDAVGASIFQLILDDNTESHEQLKDCLLKNRTTTLRHKKENTQWLESAFAPWFDEKENILGTIIQTTDISGEVEKELELERIKTMLQAKSEIAKVGSWEYTLETEKLVWCDVTKRMHHVDEDFEPSVNEGIEFYKQGYSRNKISMLFHNALQNGIAFNERLIIQTATGEERWVMAGGKPIYEHGKITKLLGTFQDIHDQVIAETKIKESKQLLTTLIENLPINVFLKDKESRKILVNRSECEYIGASANEILGKTDFDFYDEKVAQISRDEDLEVMRTFKSILGKETICVKKDGTTTNFLTSKIPLINLEGQAYGIIGMSMDITHIKQKEDELRNLINITAVQNKKLVNFAHIVSHNLRSHTANFSMLLDFLVKEIDEKEKERIMEMLLHASDNLLETLENLNEVVEISTNINLDKKSLNLNESVIKVQQNLSALLQNNKVEVLNAVPKGIFVMCVPAYLESIILNLLTNAVKYKDPNRKPKIELRAEKQDKGVLFRISDNGLGIDLIRYGGKIFGMYKTFHNNKDARGLGLYIIKNQIEAMGGHISLKSEVGKGTTFNIFFNE